MAGVLYLGSQKVTPVIVHGGEENPLFQIKDGVITKNVSNGINAVGVKEVDDFGLYSAFYTYGYSSSDEPWGYFVKGEVSFPDLEKVGHCGMKETFYGQYYITKVSMPKLKVIEESGLNCAFLGNYSYRYALEVNLDSLEDIKKWGLYNAFEYHNLSYLMLPSLKPENFMENNSQFYCMLYNVSNCTVYFPSSMQQAIGSWSDVISGFNGTSTTVIFYIPTKITVNIEQENATISSTDNIYNGVIFAIGSSANYVVYDSSTSKAYLGTEKDCVEGGEPRTVNVDLTSGEYNKITIRTNIALNNPVLLWNNISIQLTQESENVYSVYLSDSVGETLTFYREQSAEGPAFSYEITTTGEDIDETITMPVYVDFDYPTLSSNGVLGGDSFAVSATIDDTNTYKMFDRDDNTYWENNNSDVVNYIILYNPKPFFFNLFAIYKTGALDVWNLRVSDDGVNWSSVVASYNDYDNVYLISTNNVTPHKYYRIGCSPDGNTVKCTKVYLEGKVLDNGD